MLRVLQDLGDSPELLYLAVNREVAERWLASIRRNVFTLPPGSRLKKLAAEVGLTPGSYDLRSNKTGIAVSGEVTLASRQR